MSGDRASHADGFHVVATTGVAAGGEDRGPQPVRRKFGRLRRGLVELARDADDMAHRLGAGYVQDRRRDGGRVDVQSEDLHQRGGIRIRFVRPSPSGWRRARAAADRRDLVAGLPPLRRAKSRSRGPTTRTWYSLFPPLTFPGAPRVIVVLGLALRCGRAKAAGFIDMIDLSRG